MDARNAGGNEAAFIEQNCSECGKPLRIEARYAGQVGKCRHCGAIIQAGQLPAAQKKPQPAPQSTRRVSLDVLRGFDMFWIIGADGLCRSLQEVSGGESAPGLIKGIARQLEHVSWEGFVFYDLIFPLFVFVVGMSSVLSLSKIIEREGKAAAIKRILRRAALLFLLGVLYDAIDEVYSGGLAAVMDENLLCGVLQRIALCYLFTGLLVCAFELKGLIASFAVLLIGYWALLSFVPAPGEAQVAFEREHNISHAIDRMIPPYYDTDPEGPVSTFPAIATCLLGVFAAIFIRESDKSEADQVKWLMLAGLAMVVLGYLWGIQMPIIKRLWTPSYVFVAGGYSLMLLGFFMWVVDIKEWEGWAQPFIWIGSNSIVAYFFGSILNLEFWGGLVVGENAITPGLEAFLALLQLALTVTCVYILYRKKIFVRV